MILFELLPLNCFLFAWFQILDGKYLEVCSSEATSIDAPIVAAKLSSYQNLEKGKYLSIILPNT